MDMMWYRRRGLMVTPHIESVTGSIASFNSDYNKIPVKRLICNIEPIQEGTGDPSPENIRPISGRTGVSVVRTGINVWDEEWESGQYNSASVKAPSNVHIRSKNPIPVKPNTTYYMNSAWKNVHLIVADADENVLYRTVTLNNGLFTTPDKGAFVYFNMASAYGTTYNHDISINYPSTDTGYHPYSGSTYTVNWETEAGTVYGGTLDVVSGKLTVNRGIKVFNGSENWISYPSFNGYFTSLTSMKQGTRQDGSCNMLKLSKSATASQTNVFWLGVSTKYVYVIGVYESMGSTLNDFKSYLSEHNLEVVYPLETAIEIQLTPQEIRTLLGVNNIWCDSGDVTVDYWKWGK